MTVSWLGVTVYVITTLPSRIWQFLLTYSIWKRVIQSTKFFQSLGSVRLWELDVFDRIGGVHQSWTLRSKRSQYNSAVQWTGLSADSDGFLWTGQLRYLKHPIHPSLFCLSSPQTTRLCIGMWRTTFDERTWLTLVISLAEHCLNLPESQWKHLITFQWTRCLLCLAFKLSYATHICQFEDLIPIPFCLSGPPHGGLSKHVCQAPASYSYDFLDLQQNTWLQRCGNTRRCPKLQGHLTYTDMCICSPFVTGSTVLCPVDCHFNTPSVIFVRLYFFSVRQEQSKNDNNSDDKE